MATFDISIPGCILCCDTGSQISSGENLSLTIDGVKYPGLLTNPVSALVNTLVSGSVYDPSTNSMVPGYTYNVTVDDSDMPVVGGFPLTELDITDIVAWECESCCVELDARITVLEAAIGLGTTYYITGPVVDDSDPVIAPAVAKDGDTVAQKNVSGAVEFWSYDSLIWTQHFKILATGLPRVLSGLGAPGGAPSTIDPTAVDADPAIYWDQTNDVSYQWDLAATSWIADVTPPRVLTDTVDPVGAPSTIDATADDSFPAVLWQQATNALWGWDVGTNSWLQVTGPRQVLQGAGAPAGIPSFIDSSALNTLPSLYWDTSTNTIYSWDLVSVSWELSTNADNGALDIAPSGGDVNKLDFTHTGSDGVPDVTTDSSPGPGVVNSNANASVVGADIATYTVHDIRGDNDGTALDTPTAGAAQKVLIDETIAGVLRTSRIFVERYIESTVFLDLTYGDDATGLRERADKPFLTYAAAHTAAVTGDTIKVSAEGGVYVPPVPAQGIYAIGKSLIVDLTKLTEVQGTLLSEDSQTLTVIGECDFYSFNASGGNIRGRIGRLKHVAGFASFASIGGGFSPSVELDIQSIIDGGGGALNGFLISSTVGGVMNLQVRGEVVSNDGFISITNMFSGSFTINIQGDLSGAADDLIYASPTSGSVVKVNIRVLGDITNTGEHALNAEHVDVKLSSNGTIQSSPLDDASGAAGVIHAGINSDVIVDCARVFCITDGAALAAVDGGTLFIDCPLFQINAATGFLMSTYGSAGTSGNEITVRGYCWVVYPGVAGNFHDNVSNTGTVIRFQGRVLTNLTTAANTALPWPVEGADATGCTFPVGDYSDSQDLIGY